MSGRRFLVGIVLIAAVAAASMPRSPPLRQSGDGSGPRHISIVLARLEAAVGRGAVVDMVARRE
jgi:hypothetical protein